MHWLLPKLKGVRVLMYHHVWPNTSDSLTVTPQQLEEHFSYLKIHNYRTIPVSLLIDSMYSNRPLPENVIIITFDDGYRNQIDFVEPLLKKYGFCACLFLVGEKVMSASDQANDVKESYLSVERINKADRQYFEFGLHGYSHKALSQMTTEEFEADLILSKQVFSAMNISVAPVFAYPYGDRSPDKEKMAQIKGIMQACGIKAAFRIGNSAVSFPVKDRYELKRIDITGFDNIKRFRIKLSKGKLKPF